MRSIRHGVILGLLVAAIAAPTAASPPPAPSGFEKGMDAPKFVTRYDLPTLREIQQDLVIALVAIDGYTVPALPVAERWVSQVALSERTGGALDLAGPESSIDYSTISAVDITRRWRVTLGDHGRIPLRI